MMLFVSTAVLCFVSNEECNKFVICFSFSLKNSNLYLLNKPGSSFLTVYP